MAGQTRGNDGQGDNSVFADWDEVFADPDPTRILTPGADEAGSGSDAGISATRYQAETNAAPEPDGGVPSETVSKSRPVVSHRSSGYRTGAETDGVAVAAGQSLTAAGGQVPRTVPSSAYRRIQFIPSIIGVLAGYTAGKGLVYVGQVLAEAFGMKVYESPTAAVLGLTAGDSSNQALPWTIILATAYFCAFMLAGYTAARMSAIAPAKQAMGVTLVTLLGLLLSSLLTWLSSLSGGSLTPTFSLSYFLADSVSTGLLTLLAFFALVLIGALAGAGIGSRYHKKLARFTS